MVKLLNPSVIPSRVPHKLRVSKFKGSPLINECLSSSSQQAGSFVEMASARNVGA